jgi:hypothetical protein
MWGTKSVPSVVVQKYQVWGINIPRLMVQVYLNLKITKYLNIYITLRTFLHAYQICMYIHTFIFNIYTYTVILVTYVRSSRLFSEILRENYSIS